MVQKVLHKNLCSIRLCFNRKGERQCAWYPLYFIILVIFDYFIGIPADAAPFPVEPGIEVSIQRFQIHSVNGKTSVDYAPAIALTGSMNIPQMRFFRVQGKVGFVSNEFYANEGGALAVDYSSLFAGASVQKGWPTGFGVPFVGFGAEFGLEDFTNQLSLDDDGYIDQRYDNDAQLGTWITSTIGYAAPPIPMQLSDRVRVRLKPQLFTGFYWALSKNSPNALRFGLNLKL